MMLSTEIDLTFEGKVIRIVDQNGEPWFVLTDVCRALGIQNPTRAAARLDDDERSNLKLDRGGELLVVSSPGLNKIILRSDDAIKPGTFAHRFCRWVTHEVIPAIFRYGQYPPPPETEPEMLERPVLVEPWLAGTEADRFFDECRRIYQTDDPKVLEDRLNNVISASRLRALKQGGGVETMLYKTRTWHTLASAGFDFRYILNENWIYTPDERALLDDLRTLDDQAKAMAMHRIGGQIETLRIASDQG